MVQSSTILGNWKRIRWFKTLLQWLKHRADTVCLCIKKHSNVLSFLCTFVLVLPQGVYYEIYRHNKTCTKAPLKRTWFPLGIPKDAHFLTEVVVGTSSAPGEGLLVNNWIGQLPELKGELPDG